MMPADDLAKAFEKLHDADPDIEVLLSVPTPLHAEPQWGNTVGRKPESSEDFNSYAVDYARRKGFTGSDKDARLWFLGRLMDYSVKDRIDGRSSQRIERSEDIRRLSPEIVWISTDLLIRGAGRAAANFIRANPVYERVAAEPERVSSALPHPVQAESVSGQTSAIEEQIQTVVESQNEIRKSIAEVRKDLPRRRRRPVLSMDEASPEEKIIIEAIQEGRKGMDYVRFCQEKGMGPKREWQDSHGDPKTLVDAYERYSQDIQSKKSYVARKFGLLRKPDPQL